MALYETLIEGGHEHLIDAVKARIAQKADAIVEDELKPIIENQPSATLEGELLVADDAADLPPVMVHVDGKSTQDGTPTPDAPVEIVSVDGVALVMAGKNVLPDFIGEEGFVEGFGITLSNNNTVATVVEDTSKAICVIPWRANASIVMRRGVSGNPAIQLAWFESYPVSGSSGKYKRVMNTSVNTNIAASGETVDGYAAFVIPKANINGVSSTEAQAEFGNSSTAYEPYHATTVPLYDGTLRSLPDGTKDTLALTYLRPSTREGWAWYSRELVQYVDELVLDGDWITGIAARYLTATSDETSPAYEYAYIFTYAEDSKMTNYGIGYADKLQVKTFVQSNPSECLTSAGTNAHVRIQLHMDRFGGVAAYRPLTETQRKPYVAEWLTEHPITTYYAKATPVTTQLDPIELPVLPAPNCTVWADPTANLKLTYTIDSETIEESLESGIGKAFSSVAPVETSPATDNHGIGSRIVYNETLYKVTSAIAAGEDIVPGTNVTATTVAAELLATQA